MTTPAALVVVIPARDEEALIARCLDSVQAARRLAQQRLPVTRITVVVVADSCTDATAEIARRYTDVVVVEVAAANVGVARRSGVEVALATSGAPADRTWIANTDADSVVPRRWLLEQARLAGRGADVMIGTVRPFFDDLSPAQVTAWSAGRVRGVANGHVHGANLGIRADVYARVGGFAPIAEHEDVDLVARCIDVSATTVATTRGEVTTSGRSVGRTPGGYAAYLSTALLARTQAIPDPAEVPSTEKVRQ